MARDDAGHGQVGGRTYGWVLVQGAKLACAVAMLVAVTQVAPAVASASGNPNGTNQNGTKQNGTFQNGINQNGNNQNVPGSP
jgi:hypothetical protein